MDAASLIAHLDSAHPRILDCRHDLAHPELGHDQYRQGHILGAVFAHLDRDLSGRREAHTGRHPLPARDELASKIRSWGIDPGMQVVVYDANEGSYAARAWWLLRWMGHSKVALLDGGWQAWIGAGGPTSTEESSYAPGGFTAGPALQTVSNLEDVMSISHEAVPSARRVIVDARASDRYEGRNESIDPVAGHIPGALNRPWKQNLGEAGRFKSPAQLRQEFSALLGGRAARDVTMQCGSGVTACHNLLALHVAGLDGASLYPGSWSQWICDPARPISTGASP